MHTAENIGKERRKSRNPFTGRRRGDCRRGSYVVEAAITLPVLLIAMIVLSSIVLYYSCIEDAAFITATEFRKGSIEAVVSEGQPLIPLEVAERTRDNHPILDSHRILEYGFRKNRNGLNELIYLNLELDMKTRNPLGILSQSRYDSALMTRAYVGQVRNCKAMTEAEFRNELADGVFIFPQDGEKYHNKNCTFVRSETKAVALTESVKRKYTGCRVCRSKEAASGTRVYVFPEYGSRYHLPGCRVLERRCIEIEKDVAKERKYTPCSKCGG
ncbi:MAG: hypothetical protein SPG71_03380 [Clostridia bacterium]|uniref:Pilus assembly protein n=1 Tax=Mogibacterium kristiansenii TaxID=2606708 RepID=A0A6N7XMD1_9FIRM|nr:MULTISPECIES: hypothetical protein [Mogibacterium]MDY5450420.1 hypothetical protein [Clostridia bacterium]MCI7123543.1 hypothetical protein [Mogibacterium sp.]MDD6699547.1 hypothetical protein [Mogibacterium kristiansenii]MEE0370585.1 hypothetical protein [Clostridia bacterium]MST71116.1 hypothetical protein [Mogibacterium kristiansenii]